MINERLRPSFYLASAARRRAKALCKNVIRRRRVLSEAGASSGTPRGLHVAAERGARANAVEPRAQTSGQDGGG